MEFVYSPFGGCVGDGSCGVLLVEVFDWALLVEVVDWSRLVDQGG